MKLSRKTITYLILIVILAAGLRTIRAFEQTRYDPDAYLIFFIAKNISDGGISYAYDQKIDQTTPPLLPLIESSGRYINLSPDTVGLLVGGILGSLMPIAIFFMVLNIVDVKKDRWQIAENGQSVDNRQSSTDDESLTMNNNSSLPFIRNLKFEINNEFLSLLGAFLVAVHPYLIRISVGCMRESLYIPILVLAILLGMYAAKNKSCVCWGLMGFCSVIGSMTRREGIEIIIIFLLWFVFDIIYYLFSSSKYVAEEKRNFYIYKIKSFFIFMIFSIGIILLIKYFLLPENCKWDIISFAESGINILKRILY
jgi:hypothetical protein